MRQHQTGGPSLNRAGLLSIAERLMRQPSAPYFEQAVRAEAETICREEGLPFRRDAFGNLIIELRTRENIRPLALAAHLDHPGFMVSARPGKKPRARFLGSVPQAWFQPGTRLRIFPGAVPARLGQPSAPGSQEFHLDCEEALTGPRLFAMWDLPPFQVKDGRIRGRSCDDLIGAAALLGALIELKRRRARVHVIGLLARAEEIGFQGALMIAEGKELPPQTLILSLETSRELPPARLGQGVIIRTGDRSSIFSSKATRYLAETAAALTRRAPFFRWQRALMSGGTCEATAYQEFGYECAAVCIALGNYHNCGPRHRIASEYVHVQDALNLQRLMVEAARQMPNYDRLVQRLPARLKQFAREARRKLGGSTE